jgi:hypothetical protein
MLLKVYHVEWKVLPRPEVLYICSCKHKMSLEGTKEIDNIVFPEEVTWEIRGKRETFFIYLIICSHFNQVNILFIQK